MNLLNRMMSYDTNKIENQEQCNCEECVSTENVKSENQIVEYPKLSEEEIENIINERYFDKDKKTKTFIRKALRKHGDRYDYSNTVYVKYDEKIEIICRVDGHEPFQQAPHNHLNGNGCKLCGIEKRASKQRMTLKEFIEKANKIHGNKYDYSKVEYKGIKIYITIICPIHGDFSQTPDSHLQGSGCRKCQYEKLSIELRLELNEFIEKSRGIHGDKYDYSKVNYINANTEVIITCPIHGDFLQTPHNHSQGQGCQKCKCIKISEAQKMTKEEFVKRAREIHGDKYDYSKVDYLGIYTEVIITCPIHGDFSQTPQSHLVGCGCRKCKSYIGETKVRNFLTENNIEFVEQKKFKDCKDSNSLPFDFYVTTYNLCIEYDGIQHFIPTSFKKESEEEKLKNFEYVKKHDEIKNNYCKKNGINLLRIRYDENVEEKLVEYFSKL